MEKEGSENSENIYEEDAIETMCDDDELSAQEAAFMRGYNQAL